MEDLTDQEIDIIRHTQRSIKWRPYTRTGELVLGIGILIVTFWAIRNRAVFEYLTNPGGMFGMWAGLGGATIGSALRNRGYKRDKLLTKLVGSSDISASD